MKANFDNVCRALALATLLVAAQVPVASAQQMPCSDCGSRFTRIDVNSVTIRQPTILAFDRTSPPARDVADWRGQAARLGYALILLDSMPKTVYVATDSGEILYGVSQPVKTQRGFLFVTQTRGVGDIRPGSPTGLNLAAQAIWYRIPALAQVYLELWPIPLSVLLVVWAGASSVTPRRTWLALAVGGALILVWSVGLSVITADPDPATSTIRDSLIMGAVGVTVPLLTALTSLQLARVPAGVLPRIAVPALLGFTGFAFYPYFLIVAACMAGSCL